VQLALRPTWTGTVETLKAALALGEIAPYSGMEHIAVAHQRLMDGLIGLTNEQVRQPSLLPGWTVGHALSHIALNAEAFVRVAKGLAVGEVGSMYPTSESRDEAIEAGANRSAAEIAAHCQTSNAELLAIWSSLTPAQLGGQANRTPGTPTFPATNIPMARLREIEVHSSDTGLPALAISEWSNAYVDADLPIQFATVATRLGQGFAAIDETGKTHESGDCTGVTALNCTRRELLAWTLNRTQPANFPIISGWQAPPPPPSA
jgi:maleylpyruvate isomerase